MELVNYSLQERFTPGHHNGHDNIVIQHGSESIELESGHGSGDRLYVARSGDHYYVLCVNYGLPYCGLAEYNVANLRNEAPRGDVGEDDYMALGASGECFFQEHNVDEVRADLLDLGWLEMIEVLQDYLPY